LELVVTGILPFFANWEYDRDPIASTKNRTTSLFITMILVSS